MRGVGRLLLTLLLAAGVAGYLKAEDRVTPTDARVAMGSASAMSAALLRSEGSVGATSRVPGTRLGITSTAAPTAPAAVAADALAATAPGAGSTVTASPDVTETSVTASAPVGPPVTVTVTVVHDGVTQVVTTTASTVAAVLAQIGVPLGSLDRVSPAAADAPSNGETIRVVRVRDVTIHKYIVVSATATTEHSSKVELGSQSVQAGVNGSTEKNYQQTFDDGQLVSTALVSTTIVRAMQPQITFIGTGEPTFVAGGGSKSGSASWYGANGLTAASPDLPFGTVVKVTDSDNGHTVNVTIDDRGPYAGADRIIDLSPLAFSQLAPTGAGVIPVQIQW